MNPTPEQVRTAAYYRWQRRGGWHGQHHDDWLAAEQALRFALNYMVACRIRLNVSEAPTLGASGRPVCRFCEQAAPRTRFEAPAPVVPPALGGNPPRAADQCAECRSMLADLDGPVEAFLGLVAEAATSAARLPSIPMPAYKGLVRSALAILPPDLLELCPDAVEWVCNPDHDLDAPALAALGPVVHTAPAPFQAPWVAVACKTVPEAAMPQLLAFFASDRFTIELPVPLCAGDDDLDGAPLDVPRVPTLDGLTDWPGPLVEHRLRVATQGARRRLAVLAADS
jgi:hypothetical protein